MSITCFALLLSAPAFAESELVLRPFTDEERIAATTFDIDGQKVGRSFFEIESDETGVHRMKVDLAVTDGGANRSEATFETVHDASGNETLRLLEQRSQAVGKDGVAFDLLVVDHRRRRATCISTAPDEATPIERHVDLPAEDRVVNVPLHLLFRPLARGKVEEIRFQLVLCRSGPKVQDMLAVRGPRSRRDGREVVEIQYGPDFGTAIAFFASRLLPRFSFWLDADEGGYLAHRMPLYRKGPDVLLVRQGMIPPDLGIAMR